MNEREVSEAVTDWIGDTLGVPAGARYAYPVASFQGPMTTEQPSAVAIVERKRTMMGAEAIATFPWLAQLQQVALVRAFDIAASLMLAVEKREASALEVFQRLQGYGATLEESALGDPTLGGRVEMVAPVIAFDYSAVFAETEDGTRGRMVAIQLTVGEDATSALDH